jgi:hypothetical protein
MNRATRTNHRRSFTAKSTSAGSGRSGGFRPRTPGRPDVRGRSNGYGRRPASPQSEFAPPATVTPALPAADTSPN